MLSYIYNTQEPGTTIPILQMRKLYTVLSNLHDKTAGLALKICSMTPEGKLLTSKTGAVRTGLGSSPGYAIKQL